MSADAAIDEGEVRTPGGRFRFLAAGDGPLVLCLHGFPDHAPSFASMLGALARAGYRAVAPWMRGYAPSTLDGPFDVETLAADAAALAAALAPDAPARIVGHDWGAVTAYAALARAPERFACAVTMAVPHPLAFLRGLARSAAQRRRSWYMARFQLPGAGAALVRRDCAMVDALWRAWSPGLRLTDEDMRALKACLLASMPGPIAYYRAMLRPVLPAVRRIRSASGERIAAPVLQLVGADDGCIGPEIGDGQERFFRGEFAREVVEGAGHFLHLEKPREVEARVVAWLARHA